VLGCQYALIAVAFTLIFGVLGILNNALPDFFMLGAYAAFGVVSALDGGGLPAALGAATLSGLLCGVLFYAVALRRLTQRDLFPLFIATLGISMVLQNAVARVAGPDTRSFPVLTTPKFHDLGIIQISDAQILLLGFTAVFLVGLWMWVGRTTMGRSIRAVSENRMAAQTLGINVTFVMLVTVAVASAMAAVTGVLVSNVSGTVDPFVGVTIATKMFIVTLVAGGRSLGATVAIGIALGLVESLTVAYVSSGLQDLGGLIALLAVLLLKPQGLTRVIERVG